MARSVLDEPEAETLDALRAQVAAIRALPTAGDDADSSVFAYRYSFALPHGVAPDAFWETLQLKAAQAQDFVGVIDSCQRRTEDVALGFVREIVVKPAPSVVVNAVERVAFDTAQRTVLYRQRSAGVPSDRFCCINSVVRSADNSEDGAGAGAARYCFEGVYCYPSARDASAFLSDNAAMFERLKEHACCASAPG